MNKQTTITLTALLKGKLSGLASKGEDRDIP